MNLSFLLGIVFTSAIGSGSFIPSDPNISAAGTPSVPGSNSGVEQVIAKQLSLPLESTLHFITQRTMSTGNIKARYAQYHMRIPVFGTVVTAEKDMHGNLVGISSASVVTDISTSTLATAVSSDTALRSTALHFKVSDTDLAEFSWNLRTSLIFYRANNSAPVKLCYLTNFFTHPPYRSDPMAPHAIVDSRTGEVINHWDGISAYVTKSGVGGNSGIWGQQSYTDLTLTLESDLVTCTFISSNVKVQNLAGATSGAFTAASVPCSQLTSASYDLINGGYASMNDAARYGEITVAMYQAYTGITSPTGSLPVLARVHYGSGYDNSFWDGTQINLGDGITKYYPLTALDIIAHEFSHAFTNSYSSLVYAGQSGAINEAFSDMGGQAAQYYYNGTNDFIVGRLITKSGSGIRSMCNPTSDGHSIDNAANYVSTMDLHYACGVYNKAFCLLAKKSGWNTQKAFQVFANANALYWEQSTTFSQGVCGAQTSATDQGYSSADVAAAFSAVGLTC